MSDNAQDVFAGQLVFNGINAVTGEYGLPPLSAQELARLIRGKPTPQDYRRFVEQQKRLAVLAKVADRLQRVSEAEISFRQAAAQAGLAELQFKARLTHELPVKPGAGDPSRVEDVGWALILPAEMNPTLREAIKEALHPLLDLRRQQAGDLFRIYEGGEAYRSGERKDQYFERLGVGAGLVDPREMPFYVLLVGTPEEIPYEFQYQLDVMRAVGRLDFGSDVDAYADYARHVVAAETGAVRLPRRVAFFAPSNPGDRATQLSTEYLVRPLYQSLTDPAPPGELRLKYDWDITTPLVGEGQATRGALARLLGERPEEMPALLFTASHGVEFPAGHPDQLRHQGARLCQEWRGPGAEVRRDYFFAGEDIPPNVGLRGMIAFLFACYGAGTPKYDQFAIQAFKVREKIAPRSFTAALPQALLRRGALAVIGHVERAWGYSFVSPSGHLENQTFVTAMRTLMNGDPVGLATDASFNMRYAALSSDLSVDLEEMEWNPRHLSDYELVYRWTANNDARSYVVIGDPAARIPMEGTGFQAGYEASLVTAEVPVKEHPAVPEPPLTVIGAPVEPEVPAEPEVSGEAMTITAAETGAPGAPAGILEQEVVGVDFGLGEQFERLRESLRAFTDQLAGSLGRAAQDITTLDVRTYVTEDLQGVVEALDARREIAADLRAVTRVAFDGDVDVFVPKSGSRVDETLWVIHKAMVEEAQTARARFLATMAELAARLLDSLRIGS